MRFCTKKDSTEAESAPAEQEPPKPKRRRSDQDGHDVSNAEPHGGPGEVYPHLFQL